MNLLHLFVKILGGSFYDEASMTTYYYRGEINLWFLGKWIDLQRWAVHQYYSFRIWWLSRKIDKEFLPKCGKCGMNYYNCLCSHDD